MKSLKHAKYDQTYVRCHQKTSSF